MIEKYYNEDKTAIGVLVSPEYGSGWSTWAHWRYDDEKDIAVDKRIIEAWKDGATAKEMEELLSQWGYNDIYIGSGYNDLELKWVPIGQKYFIYEYDGFETLITEDMMETA